MSELMDRAVIGMPFDMAMQNHLSRMQFYNRAKAILAERDALMAERDALQGQLDDLRNGWANSVKAHSEALAERDAAFAAGQRDMQERAIQDVAEWGCLFLGSGENVTVDVIDDLRDLLIMTRPDGR